MADRHGLALWREVTVLLSKCWLPIHQLFVSLPIQYSSVSLAKQQEGVLTYQQITRCLKVCSAKVISSWCDVPPLRTPWRYLDDLTLDCGKLVPPALICHSSLRSCRWSLPTSLPTPRLCW